MRQYIAHTVTLTDREEVGNMLLAGEILDGTYQIMQKIGSGGTGDVYLAYHMRLEKYVVVKKIKDNFVSMVNVRAEVDILKRLKHTYLPQVYDFIQYGTQVYTVMDYIEGTDMTEYIKYRYVLDEETILKWLRQLCEVLDYLHSQNPPIIHSDVKPGNIMITSSGDVCLIDFNISLDGDESSQISGISIPYASPEQYTKAMLYASGQEYRHIILDGRSDMYSLGSTFYQLVTFTAPNNPCEYTPPLTSWKLPYNDALLEVIDKSMMTDIDSRYCDMKEMMKALRSIYKRTWEYKLYIIGVIMSSMAYLIAMSIGIYCVIYGFSLKTNENFEQTNKSFIASYESGDYESAINQGYDILNNKEFNKILSKNKEDKMNIFHTLGECYFEYEDYDEAAENYKQALACSNDMGEYAEYYRDYIVALVRTGDVKGAQRELTMLESYGVDNINIELVDAEILVHNGQYNEAISKIESLVEQEIDERIKLHLLILGSDAAANNKEYDKQIEYLLKAQAIDNTTGVVRKLGNAYMSKVYSSKMSDRSAKEYYKKAAACYEELYDKSYASVNDGINLAICYRAIDEYDESIDVLKDMESEYEDYRIYMHLAFSYDKSGDGDRAKKYVNKCFELYDKTPDSDKESKGSDNMQSLVELKKKYQ